MSAKREDLVADIQKEILFDAPIEKVWQAVSTSEGIATWFMPNDFQPVLGHEFYLQSQFGTSPCKVLELDPPKRLKFSWDLFGWEVVFDLKELDGKTKFTLTHSGWGKPDEATPRSGESQEVIRNRMNDGWQFLIADSLRKAVEG